MNENVRNNVFFKSSKHFKESMCEFFDKTISEIAHSLRGRINDNFQTIKLVPSGWMGIDKILAHRNNQQNSEPLTTFLGVRAPPYAAISAT